MNLENRYYQLSSKQKTSFKLKLIFCCIAILIPIVVISIYFSIYFLSVLVLWILLSVLAPFFDMPSMIKTGKLKYESLFLISEKEKNNQITIHGGTLFDYYFTLNKNSSAKERKNLILSEYLKGLLHILDSNKDNLSLEIIGSTYILNQRTAEKIGFEVRKTNMVQLIILILNYPNLICTKSFASKKLSFPNLKEIRTYKANIQSLNNSAATIRKIQNALERSLSY